MPFAANWIEERLAQAQEAGRLSHAYLLTGQDPEELEALFLRLAGRLIGADPLQSPDVHIIRPESKSRRLTIEQVRELEHQLHLKSYMGGLKIASIIASDRMCLGQAQAANAFLKTLEEPPDNCVIFLLSTRPDQLLPTIRSRCLTLPLADAPPATPTEGVTDVPWITEWFAPIERPGARAYRRAALLQDHWRQLRESLEEETSGRTFEDDDAEKAFLESLFLLKRDDSIATLINASWERRGNEPEDLADTIRACEALEELRYALSRNIDQQLALERCCLKISRF
jgi:DNA polymerase-3 subunit delta'